MNTKSKEARNEALQGLVRHYLGKLRHIAKKHGMLPQLNNIIASNRRKECAGTEYECMMLARMCDDERLSRVGVPAVIGKTYRSAFNDDEFKKVKKLKHVGIYSKVSAMLLGAELKAKKEKGYNDEIQ